MGYGDPFPIQFVKRRMSILESLKSIKEKYARKDNLEIQLMETAVKRATLTAEVACLEARVLIKKKELKKLINLRCESLAASQAKTPKMDPAVTFAVGTASGTPIEVAIKDAEKKSEDIKVLLEVKRSEYKAAAKDVDEDLD